MKILHTLKSEPDETTKAFIEATSDGEESTVFPLYEEDPDYEKLIDLIFENDKVISWW
ncbi:hypothetical protein ACFL9T_00520 [Thermodesulfobacteriota bacterium]